MPDDDLVTTEGVDETSPEPTGHGDPVGEHTEPPDESVAPPVPPGAELPPEGPGQQLSEGEG